MNTFDQIRIVSAADLAAAVPFLIGYQPVNELVSIGYRDTQITTSTGLGLRDSCRYGYAHTAYRLTNNMLSAVALIAYGPQPEAEAAVADAKDACHRYGLPVREALRVSDGCWWSCLHPDRPGTPINPVTAAATHLAVACGRGIPTPTATPAGTRRSDAAALLWVATMRAAPRIQQRQRDLGEGEFMLEALRLVEHLTDTGARPSLDQAAAVAVYLTIDGIRDAIEEMTVTIVDSGDAHTAMLAWCWLAPALPSPTRWRAASLAAYAAWVDGCTTIATDALHLSLKHQPGSDNRIGLAVKHALDQGLGPYDIAAPTYADLFGTE